MPFTVSKTYSFSASHVLANLAPGHPCSRLHGHNYEVTVCLSADNYDGDTGFVCDYRVMDEALKVEIARRFDHRHLNDVMGGQPSAERLAEHIAQDIVLPTLPHMLFPSKDRRLSLVSVTVKETPKTEATYIHQPTFRT